MERGLYRKSSQKLFPFPQITYFVVVINILTADRQISPQSQPNPLLKFSDTTLGIQFIHYLINFKWLQNKLNIVCPCLILELLRSHQLYVGMW